MFKLGDQVEKVQLENTMETQKTTRNEDVNATLIIGGSQAKEDRQKEKSLETTRLLHGKSVPRYRRPRKKTNPFKVYGQNKSLDRKKKTDVQADTSIDKCVNELDRLL